MSQIGVTGLAVMGANLARNIASRGVPIAVHNRTAAKTRDFVSEFGSEGDFTGSESLEEFVQSLERPRRIIVMVKAGAPVDGVIEDLVPLLDKDDIIIDAGNSHFPDTVRREATATYGSDLAPVLAGRQAAVDRAVEELFPSVRRRSGRAVDPAGWHSGRQAADAADLGTPHERLTAP